MVDFSKYIKEEGEKEELEILENIHIEEIPIEKSKIIERSRSGPKRQKVPKVPNARKFIKVFETQPVKLLADNDKLRYVVKQLTRKPCRESIMTCAFILKSIAEIILDSEKNKK
nr:MAG: hypothetical protein [uncultured archaeon]